MLCILKEKAAEDSITFFGHTKGTIHTKDGVYKDSLSEAVRIWTKACYVENLQDIEKVENLFLKYDLDCLGCFKSVPNPSHFPKETGDWHYSGSFFWFRNSLLKGKTLDKNYFDHRYAVEGWLSTLVPKEKAGALFGGSLDCRLYEGKSVIKLFGDIPEYKEDCEALRRTLRDKENKARISKVRRR